MTSREITEWIAYDSLEPVGALRGDVQAALVAATVANCHRASKSKPFRIADFLPFRSRRDERRGGDMAAAFAALRAVATSARST